MSETKEPLYIDTPHGGIAAQFAEQHVRDRDSAVGTWIRFFLAAFSFWFAERVAQPEEKK